MLGPKSDGVLELVLSPCLIGHSLRNGCGGSKKKTILYGDAWFVVLITVKGNLLHLGLKILSWALGVVL